MKNAIYIGAIFLCTSVFANDVLQWRGSLRDGIYPESNLLKNWSLEGPKMLWSSKEVGRGFSPPAIQGDRLFITGLSDDGKREIFTALDKSGKKLWSLDYGKSWEKSFTDARIMPTISNDKAYIISGSGEVICIDLKEQKIKWSVDALKNYQGKPRDWGYAENPIVYDGKVFMTVGGTKTAMIALDAQSGTEVWKTKPLNRFAAYFSPLVIETKSGAQIVSGAIGLAFGVDVKTGEILWTHELRKLGTGGFAQETTWETNVAMPIYKDEWLFISSGNNYGTYMLELPEWKGSVKIIWTAPEFDTHHGGDVLLNGKLYGSTWINNDKGNWACYDWQTGKEIYNEEWSGHSKGSIISADGLLYCYEEKRGQVALVNPNADKFEVISSFKLPLGSGRHWCHPVISNGVMYIRRGEALMAFDIKNPEK